MQCYFIMQRVILVTRYVAYYISNKLLLTVK